MSKTRLISLAAALAAALFSILPLRADVLETRDGSRFVGKLTKIDGGKVYFTTAFAGDLTIKQEDVVGIATNHSVDVRLSSGSEFSGLLSSPHGALQIAGPQGAVRTRLDYVAATWPTGEMDPAQAALQLHWKYEATVDINGTSGNKSQLGTDVGFGAKRIVGGDELDMYTAYNRQVSNGTASADQFKAGIDYTSVMFDETSWFLRDEAGFDRIMDLTFYETAAVGIGHDIIKNDIDTLTGRVGLAYRYDAYSSAATSNVNSAAADFELNHDLKTATWELVDKLTFLPAFSNFSDYIITQDSYFQIPLKNPAWKLRMGLSNNVNNRPPPGIKRVDTTYYTRLILDWGE